jgi:hypothetical protein
MKKSVQKKSNEKNITGYDDVLQYCNDVESGKIISCK